MIRESSIALAEPIAVAGFNIKPSTIIEGLNGESCGLGQFTENFRQEIVEVTGSEDSVHTDYMKEGSRRMAEILRTTLSNISEYGKPLAMAIAREASNCYSRNELKYLAQGSFQHRFINLDDAFFDSPLFPKEVKDTKFNYENINLDALKTLTFESPTKEDIHSFIGTSHADVVEAMRERDFTMGDAAHALGNFESLASMFVKAPNGNFDFTKVKTMDSEKLIKAYILLTRMYANSDDIPSWFKNGELARYREYVNLLWNGMTVYLLKLKQMVLSMRARKLVLVDHHTAGLTELRKGAEGRIIKADVTCYYTTEAMEKIMGSDSSMSEVLLGYYWEKVQGNPVALTELLENPARYQASAERYFAYVHEKLLVHAKDRFVESALAAMGRFVSTNALIMERVSASGQLSGDWLRARFLGELERGYYTLNAKHPNLGGDTVVAEGENGGACSMEDAIMSTRIVPVFLREIGCDMAAEILEDTYVTQAEEDNIDDKKGRLTVAVINCIARKCFA